MRCLVVRRKQNHTCVASSVRGKAFDVPYKFTPFCLLPVPNCDCFTLLQLELRKLKLPWAQLWQTCIVPNKWSTWSYKQIEITVLSSRKLHQVSWMSQDFKSFSTTSCSERSSTKFSSGTSSCFNSRSYYENSRCFHDGRMLESNIQKEIQQVRETLLDIVKLWNYVFPVMWNFCVYQVQWTSINP